MTKPSSRRFLLAMTGLGALLCGWIARHRVELGLWQLELDVQIGNLPLGGVACPGQSGDRLLRRRGRFARVDRPPAGAS